MVNFLAIIITSVGIEIQRQLEDVLIGMAFGGCFLNKQMP